MTEVFVYILKFKKLFFLFYVEILKQPKINKLDYNTKVKSTILKLDIAKNTKNVLIILLIAKNALI